QPADEFTADPMLVEKGRGLFVSLGCASCHSMKIDGKNLESNRTAKAWKDLSQPAGCLADLPPAGVPQFHLTTEQRAALAVVLGKNAPAEQPADVIHRTLITFNCYA